MIKKFIKWIKSLQPKPSRYSIEKFRMGKPPKKHDGLTLVECSYHGRNVCTKSIPGYIALYADNNSVVRKEGLLMYKIVCLEHNSLIDKPMSKLHADVISSYYPLSYVTPFDGKSCKVKFKRE